MELQDKVALVTGASRGIGAQIAVELAKKGANLYLTWTPSDRSKKSAIEVIERIRALGLNTQIHGIGVDFSLQDSPKQVVDECVTQYGHIDIVVNNAGVLQMRAVPDTSPQDYQQIMDINLRAPFFLVQAALPHLRKPARIINVSSIAARTGFAEAAVYSMSKAGLEGLTRSLARALGHDGTTVNAVAPGVVHTEMLDTWDKEDIDAEANHTPVGRRIGQPDDIAQIVTWLACGGSKWVSGQTISASGGAVLY